MKNVRKPHALSVSILAMAMAGAIQKMFRPKLDKPPEDPLRNIREAARREEYRYGSGGGYIHETGIRQGACIAKQIAKGQLKDENGLVRTKAD